MKIYPIISLAMGRSCINPGIVVDIPDKVAKSLIKNDFAREATADEIKKADNVGIIAEVEKPAPIDTITNDEAQIMFDGMVAQLREDNTVAELKKIYKAEVGGTITAALKGEEALAKSIAEKRISNGAEITALEGLTAMLKQSFTVEQLKKTHLDEIGEDASDDMNENDIASAIAVKRLELNND